jgi:hypothetical protein
VDGQIVIADMRLAADHLSIIQELNMGIFDGILSLPIAIVEFFISIFTGAINTVFSIF